MLRNPSERLRELIRERGGNPGDYVIWQQGNHVLVAVRPEAGEVTLDLPDILDGRIIAQSELPG